MAPSPQPLSCLFDYRGQIVENCEFFSGKDDYVSIVTERDPSGTYKAVAVRSIDDAREALLASEPCESVQSAIESLHAKSSEAVYLFTKTNGYGHPRDPKTEEDEIDDDDYDTASVISERSTGSSVALSTCDSSGEEITPASSLSRDKNRSPPNTAGEKPRKGQQPPAMISKVRKAKGADDSDDDEPPSKTTSPIRQQPGGPRYPPPLPWNGGRPPPPASFRGYAPGLAVAQPTSAPGAHHHQSMTPGSGVPGQQVAGTHFPAPPSGHRPMGPPPGPPASRLFDVRITIKWLHHSEQRIFESSRASIRALQDTALIYIRTHMNAFDNVTPLDHSPNKLWSMRATVKQAFFGNDAYDMSGYRGDDLTKLFTIVGKNDIPRFEIEVDYVRPPPPPASILPASTGGVSS